MYHVSHGMCQMSHVTSHGSPDHHSLHLGPRERAHSIVILSDRNGNRRRPMNKNCKAMAQTHKQTHQQTDGHFNLKNDSA